MEKVNARKVFLRLVPYTFQQPKVQLSYYIVTIKGIYSMNSVCVGGGGFGPMLGIVSIMGI